MFTDTPLEGNPLAVIPDATRVAEDLLPQIAREFNLSETVFVYPPHDPINTARVRIFTPARELPFAGHPTIGTAVLLAGLRRVRRRGRVARIILEEDVGAVPVDVHFSGRKPTSAQFTAAQLPKKGPPPLPTVLQIASAVSLEPSDFLPGWTPAAFSCGVPYLFVPVRDRQALAAARVAPDAWRFIARTWAPDAYLITPDAELPGSHFRARMFAPDFGVGEDPATGSAVAALPGYLASVERLRDGRHNWRIEQGFEMGRPSILELESDVRDGIVYTVRVGGSAVVVGEGELRVE